MAGTARLALFKSVGAVMEFLPERVDVAVASAFAGLLGRRSRKAQAGLTMNLDHVLFPGGCAQDASLLEHFVARGFRSYGQYWAEGAKLPALAKATVDERFTIAEGLEHLRRGKERGRGVIIALPHVGSWEWGGAFLDSLGLGMTAVAEELNPPELFEWFKEKRESIGIRIEALNEHVGSVLLRTLREGGVVGLLCDRDLQGNGVEVEFFGERVTMPAGPATLALRTGATLVAAACYAGPGHDHFAVVTPPVEVERTARLREDVTRVTQLIATELEGLIRRAPEQWHVLQPRFTSS
ncbi:MAG TPA: phosphatidylinositol mannoside acyltransferase [Acidimicrobiales bacterium]|nr:phosphatidylinositol mannoside acyltransferase [Acidimicrobiales bacterium]